MSAEAAWPGAPGAPGASGLSALQALLAAVLAETGAEGGWWAVDGRPVPGLGLPGEDSWPGTGACRCAGETAASTGWQLWLQAARRPGGPVLAAALLAAGALLDAQQQAQRWRLEAERCGRAGSVATDWLWETDTEGRVTWMSDGISLLTGRPAADEVGRRTGDANRPRNDETAGSWDAYRAARAAQQPFRDLIAERDTPQGTIVVAISGEPRFDADGSFLGYRGASRNVTAELAARQDALRARQLLEQTLEGLPASVMISGPDDRVLLANPVWRSSLGEQLPPGCDTWEQVVRHHVALGNYPDAIGREDAFLAWRLGLTSEDAPPQELRWRDAWALVLDRRLPDGSVVHLSVDISARKAAEAALAESELRWRFALEGAGDGVWDWNAETDRSYFSPRCLQMLGLDEHAFGNDWRHWARRLHADDRARVLDAFQRHCDGATEIYQVAYRIRHAQGHWLWLRDRGKAVLRGADGRALRVIGTHSDITRERQGEDDLREKRVAELASRSKSEFLSRMSHEMRTPLNAVLGFAQLLQQQAVYRADYLDHILLAGQHLRDLINDVLDLQQVEQGVLALSRQPLDLTAAVRDASALLGAQALRDGVQLRVAGDGPAPVLADPQRLRQVLLNLGSNAIKYNRRGGSVQWRLSPQERDAQAGWRLQVVDDGLGMDPQQLARLFQPFERLGREATSVEGTGLGLVIARRLVAAHGGSLDITSVAGSGTTVNVWLPRAEAAAAPAADTAPRAAVAPAQQRSWRVLYVEDDPLSALLFAEALRAQPQIALRVAVDAATALESATRWPPDLLVIDGHLPGALGHEVLAALRALPGLAHVPAVMATADAMPADREAALARGFGAHWTKPLDVRSLAAQLLALLHKAA
ncbi:PAS domain-containing hybrid sensor histidine kinase/response regulator [Rubrivivax sp. RP6-9]|uniref:PAS domain-containing hybrid sensor histidine kinase/response regulator n=1 Tax=Rubrivivax sp. RP6-9 TaxID=3415750 RepID=UPI003CC69ED9